MDQYFGRMRSLTTNKELPARIRFLLQNTLELRENNWVPRKAHVDNGPKTISQVRQDAVKVRFLWYQRLVNWIMLLVHMGLRSGSDCLLQDLGVFIPPQTDGMRNEFFIENSFLPTRMKFDRETIGGLADMFGQMPGMLQPLPPITQTSQWIGKDQSSNIWLVC